MSFDIRDTNFAKGVALCLLLVHHLFYYQSPLYEDILVNGRQFSNIISEYSKVCVAMFVLLSGYGLNESTNKNYTGILSFYKKHLLKLYLNYWFMWLVFVPIGIFFFDRTLEVVYMKDITLKVFINFIGLQDYFKFYGYNATWWFMSTIVSLYLLFPFFKAITYKYKKLVLFISFGLVFAKFVPETMRYWMFPFILGIYISQNNSFESIKKFMQDKLTLKLILYFVITFAIMAVRYKKGVRVDGFFALLIILMGYEFFSTFNLINKLMVFIGKHSFNIFLFHTFIFEYYLKSFSYILKYPPLIFLQLLLVCLVISVSLEKIKSYLGLFKFKIQDMKIKY